MDITNSGFDVFFKKKYSTTQEISQAYLQLIVKAANSEVGYLHILDPKKNQIALHVWVQQSVHDHIVNNNNDHPLNSTKIWGDCLEQKKWVIHENSQDAEIHANFVSSQLDLKRYISFPITINGRFVAVIGVGNAKKPYTDENAIKIQTLINHTAPKVEYKINKIKSQAKELKRAFDEKPSEEILLDMLEAISKALEILDAYTSFHQESVSFVAEKIAQEMKLPHEQITGLVIGALVHDIGKITIPPQILNKVGKLCKPEYDLLKMHAEHGATIFKNVSSPWPLVDMIGQHHERIDGSGYPKGLTGNDICIEAKIIAVADTFDAMSADRPYRKSPGPHKACEELMSNRGIKYDPYVVDAFVSCYRQDASFEGRYTQPSTTPKAFKKPRHIVHSQ
ncbi:HD domain-containing phosphohydrolase [Algibacillus agarilyticus]|uniref:HD domain-containing phosphohydrolase n=1 Tax=Algibacillus agarilyticus TaxID=2234133 RepID=UPI000DD0EBD4|nr:HD domain-containing phosphohydrolase [Algibacillus agarilyticus]